MTLEELQKFIREEHKRAVATCKDFETKDRRTLIRAIKLMEELGELCEEIVGFSATQREEKMRPENQERVAEELADVLIVALLLAENMELNVFSAIEDKIKKIEARYK